MVSQTQAEAQEELGLCARCELQAVASVKDSNESLCWDHIMEARKNGEFSVVVKAPRKPRYSIPALRDAIRNSDANIVKAHEWIEDEEKRKEEYWGLIEEMEQEDL